MRAWQSLCRVLGRDDLLQDERFSDENARFANRTVLAREIERTTLSRATAEWIGELQSAGVPVIWRPLHEAEGAWFWWGAKGPEPAKKLWGIVYDRLTNQHGLNNLIWLWNSVKTEWYPGSETVDLVSADTYAQGDHGVSWSRSLSPHRCCA